MFQLDKTHDPRRNAALLSEITGKQPNIKELIKETEQLFEECRKKEHAPQPDGFSDGTPILKKITEKMFRLFAKRSSVLAPSKMVVDSKGSVSPEWKPLLDTEYVHLLNNISREVNAADFGAIGDGKTDCTNAFKEAIGRGRVKVTIPPGVYITKGIHLPSWTWLVGAGKGVTIVKLHDQSPKGTRLITNRNHWKGNHHLSVEGMSLDWNVERLGKSEKTSTWGNHSSCLTYANVTYGWVRDVEGINPGLHCFDVTSTIYNYAGDGYRARGGSKYVWLDHLNGYGFGDDGITTHHSDYIFVSNTHMCEPSGRAHKKGFSNSNGIEVDDGSRNILLVNNSTARCFGGVEIKAHQNSSAASNVQMVGHISLNDNRSFNFRHIGHHKATDIESKSAYNITAVNLLSIAPIFTDLYKGSTPRGMVISAYKNVVIHHLTCIGNPEYDYKNNPVIAIQYRARNISLRNILIRNYSHTGAGIKVFGGENRADSIRIGNVEIQNSPLKTIEKGSEITDIAIEQDKEILKI